MGAPVGLRVGGAVGVSELYSARTVGASDRANTGGFDGPAARTRHAASAACVRRRYGGPARAGHAARRSARRSQRRNTTGADDAAGSGETSGRGPHGCARDAPVARNDGARVASEAAHRATKPSAWPAPSVTNVTRRAVARTCDKTAGERAAVRCERPRREARRRRRQAGEGKVGHGAGLRPFRVAAEERGPCGRSAARTSGSRRGSPAAAWERSIRLAPSRRSRADRSAARSTRSRPRARRTPAPQSAATTD